PDMTVCWTRGASPDGSLQGQIRWYDYAGKGATDTEGTMFLPCAVATKLPSGEARFICFYRNSLGHYTNRFETFAAIDGSCQLRTNQYVYDSNGIDLIKQVRVLGSVSRQISSNYFNTSHQVVTNYDALGQARTFTYNSNKQLLSVKTPAGLTTTNLFDTTGTWSNFLTKTVDLEIFRTNSFTYSNGYVFTETDARGITTTHTRDALGRPTQTSFPDGTSVTGSHDKLDLV